jgi:lysophospholipase L1-like esterase
MLCAQARLALAAHFPNSNHGLDHGELPRLLADVSWPLFNIMPSADHIEDPTRPVPRTREYDWMSVATWWERQRAEAAAAARGGVELLFLGDSLTEAWPDTGRATWEKHFVGLKAGSFGIGGDTTQNVLWRVTAGGLGILRPRAVVLLIGINNLGNHGDRPDAVVRGVTAVVDQLRRSFPIAKILVLGIFPSGQMPKDPARARIATVNAALPALADGKSVFHQDIGAAFLEADGSISADVMPDFLHLSPEGYRRWAEAILPTVQILLRD